MTASPGRVAAAVRRKLAEHDISGRRAAAAMGMSQQSFSDRLCGRRQFRAEELLALAGWLDVPVSELMEEPGARGGTEAFDVSRAPAEAVPA